MRPRLGGAKVRGRHGLPHGARHPEPRKAHRPHRLFVHADGGLWLGKARAGKPEQVPLLPQGRSEGVGGWRHGKPLPVLCVLFHFVAALYRGACKAAVLRKPDRRHARLLHKQGRYGGLFVKTK